MISRLSRWLMVTIGLSTLALCVSALQSAQRSESKSAVSSQTHKDYGFTSGNPSLRIPFEEDDGHIFLRVRINDSSPLWFGLDTGAVRSIIDTNKARELHLKFEGTQQVGGAGGDEEASIVKGVSIKLPGAELVSQTMWVLPLQALADANGREMSGIIGYELFSRFVVEVDYANLVINLYEPTSYQYKGTGERILLSIENGEIYVAAKISIAGLKSFDGQFVIDTGGNNSLFLASDFVEKNKLLDYVGPTLKARGGGIGGEIQMAIGRIKTLQVGRFTVDNPVTAFMKFGEIAELGKTGNIGGRFLRRFRIIFDYSRRQMILEPNTYFREAEELDMSGVAVTSSGPSYTVMTIARVRPDSAGALADLKAQDVIIDVDGQPSSKLSLAKLRKLFREEGRVYQITVKRDGQSIKKQLKLKRVI